MASASESPGPIPTRIPESPHLSVLQSWPTFWTQQPGDQGPPLPPVSSRNDPSLPSSKCGACPWVCPVDVPAGGAGLMTCPGVCGRHTSPSENSLSIRQVPVGRLGCRYVHRWTPLRLDVNTQETVTLGAVLCPREKTDGGRGSLWQKQGPQPRDSVVPSPQRGSHTGHVPPGHTPSWRQQTPVARALGAPPRLGSSLWVH